MLILVCGLPGSGKTRVSKEISKEIKWPVLRTDKIRKELFSKPTYTQSEKDLVYQVMFLIADELLKNNVNVILDAVFSRKDLRDKARALAKKNKTPFHLVEVRCQEEILLLRIDKRSKRKNLSDADRNIYFETKKEFQPIKEKHIIIDNSYGPKKTKEEIEKFLKLLRISKG